MPQPPARVSLSPSRLPPAPHSDPSWSRASPWPPGRDSWAGTRPGEPGKLRGPGKQSCLPGTCQATRARTSAPAPSCQPAALGTRKPTRSPTGWIPRPGRGTAAAGRDAPAAWHGCLLLNCAESTTDGRRASRCSFPTFWAPLLAFLQNSSKREVGKSPVCMGRVDDPGDGSRATVQPGN